MRQGEQGRFQSRFRIPAMTVEFHRQAIREGFLKPRKKPFGGGLLALKQKARNRAKRAACHIYDEIRFLIEFM
jgi:hypothetical protein